MSQSTNLYLSTRWELDDIKTVVERLTKETVEVGSNHSIAVGYFCFKLPKIKRMIHVHSGSHTPLGTAILLSMGADSVGQELLKSIAEVFGGIFVANDCDGKADIIDGNMTEGNALPYFLKYAIIEDGIEPDDIKGFITSQKSWYERITSAKMPESLRDILHKMEVSK